MNWDTSIENFKNYLKLERGLSMNSIKSYEFDLIQFKNFMIENGINESPKNVVHQQLKHIFIKISQIKNLEVKPGVFRH